MLGCICKQTKVIKLNFNNTDKQTPLPLWRPRPTQTEWAGQKSSAGVSQERYPASETLHSVNRQQPYVILWHHLYTQICASIDSTDITNCTGVISSMVTNDHPVASCMTNDHPVAAVCCYTALVKVKHLHCDSKKRPPFYFQKPSNFYNFWYMTPPGNVAPNKIHLLDLVSMDLRSVNIWLRLTR